MRCSQDIKNIILEHNWTWKCISSRIIPLLILHITKTEFCISLHSHPPSDTQVLGYATIWHSAFAKFMAVCSRTPYCYHCCVTEIQNPLNVLLLFPAFTHALTQAYKYVKINKCNFVISFILPAYI